MATKQLKVLKNIGLHKKGDNVFIPVDAIGQPIKRFWRNRFQDKDVQWIEKEKKTQLKTDKNQPSVNKNKDK